MPLDPHQIAEAFCRHHFADTYPYLADDGKWTNVGGPELVGRAAVIAHCDQAAQYLATVTSTITQLRVIRAEPLVVVEGAAQFSAPAQPTSAVASCDVFRFAAGRLVEITSYVIELKPPA